METRITKDELRDELPRLVAKSGSTLKADKELDLSMPLFEVRKLGGTLNRARKLHDNLIQWGKELSSKGFDKTIVTEIVKSAAELKQLVDLHEKAFNTPLVTSNLAHSKYKSQITSSVSAMLKMRQDGLAEVVKARALTASSKG